MENINKSILKLAVPSILANITVPLVGLVDMAVAGHLGTSGTMETASLIGGIAVGAMLFDLLYWNFGFLRAGTGGLVAQAYGGGDMAQAGKILSRALGLALMCSLFLIAVQVLFVKGAFLVVDCSPEVRELAERYFYIRIWAAPATLSLMAFKGWFIGMQDAVSPMVTDLVVNVLNAGVSIILALGFRTRGFSFDGMGFDGIAWGTVAAQYSGLLAAAFILAVRYRKKIAGSFEAADMLSSFAGKGAREFFSLNLDLFLRSLCLICIYIGFTSIAASYGDLALATAAILMKLMMLFSYFTDGFAYAAEALAGKSIGAHNPAHLMLAVRGVFNWSMILMVMAVVVYALCTTAFVGLLTDDDAAVTDAAGKYLIWLMTMPVLGCAAFVWDGIFIGATAAKPMRNAMLLSTVFFFLSYFVWTALAGHDRDAFFGESAIHGLLFGYLVHLAVRVIYLQARFRKDVLPLAGHNPDAGQA